MKYILANPLFAQALFYSAVLVACIFATMPASVLAQPNINDKVLHATSFLLLAFLLHGAHTRLHVVVQLFILLLIGLAIECLQAFLPYRFFDWWDLAADLVGASIYYLSAYRFVDGFLGRYRSLP